MRPQDVKSHGLLEVGAAALLIGDIEAKAKDQSRKYTGNQDLPDIDQLLQPSTATMASNHASSHSHLKAITAAKRLKPDPQQTWLVFFIFPHYFLPSCFSFFFNASLSTSFISSLFCYFLITWIPVLFLLLATENLYHVPFIQYDTIQNLTVCPVSAAILPCNLLFSLESLQGLLMLPVQMKQEVMFF